MIAERHNQLLYYIAYQMSAAAGHYDIPRFACMYITAGWVAATWLGMSNSNARATTAVSLKTPEELADCLPVLSCLPAVPAILSRVVSRALPSLSFQASSRPRVLTTDVGVGGRVSPLTASSNVWLSTVRESVVCSFHVILGLWEDETCRQKTDTGYDQPPAVHAVS